MIASEIYVFCVCECVVIGLVFQISEKKKTAVTYWNEEVNNNRCNLCSKILKHEANRVLHSCSILL